MLRVYFVDLDLVNLRVLFPIWFWPIFIVGLGYSSRMRGYSWNTNARVTAADGEAKCWSQKSSEDEYLPTILLVRNVAMSAAASTQPSSQPGAPLLLRSFVSGLLAAGQFRFLFHL